MPVYHNNDLSVITPSRGLDTEVITRERVVHLVSSIEQRWNMISIYVERNEEKSAWKIYSRARYINKVNTFLRSYSITILLRFASIEKGGTISLLTSHLTIHLATWAMENNFVRIQQIHHQFWLNFEWCAKWNLCTASSRMILRYLVLVDQAFAIRAWCRIPVDLKHLYRRTAPQNQCDRVARTCCWQHTADRQKRINTADIILSIVLTIFSQHN